MRKIIQIAAMPDSGSMSGSVYALCNDGTLWVYFPSMGPVSAWHQRAKPIPQDSGNDE